MAWNLIISTRLYRKYFEIWGNKPAGAARARPLCGGCFEIRVSHPIGGGRNGSIGARVHVAYVGLWVVGPPCKRLRVLNFGMRVRG
jgi:hypothetical protein